MIGANRVESCTRLAVVATHPVQYQVPWFQALSRDPGIDLHVFYALVPDGAQQGVGFGVPFAWDIPLLEGYAWEVLPNVGRSPSLRGFAANSTPGVRAALAKFRPDAVLITGWNALPLVQAYWAAVRLGIPRIVRGESNALRRRPLHTRAIHRVFLAGFDAFLSIGTANRAFYLENGVNAERIFSTKYFVDNLRFRRQANELQPQRHNIRAEWGIPSDATCILFAGKLEPKKRPLDLVDALGRARARGANIHLLVAGSGELMHEAQAMAADRGIPATFAGFLNQTTIARAYVASDCLVLPSDFGETWGLVVNEAMACGRPAIVSDRVGCAPDLIVEARTGLTYPFGDIERLTSHLVDLASAPERLAEMGREAQAHVASFSVERAVDGTLQALAYLRERHAVG